MNIHYHSPNPKVINNSKFRPYFNPRNNISENVCLTNYNSPASNMNLHTEQCIKENSKTKITYQLDSQNSASPVKSLRQNQSMLFQNLSPEITFSNRNSNNNITKSNSSNFSRKRRSYINSTRDIINNNINKKNEILDKIRYISNRIDKTINLYKDKNANVNSNNINNINNEQENNNNYSINSYNRKNKYTNRNNSKHFPFNFKYNNSNVLESMRKENARQNELINMKIRNLSQVVNEPTGLYKRMDKETKKRKENYAKLYKQKKFYGDNNLNLKINENNNKNVTYVYDPHASKDLDNDTNANLDESESTAKKKNYQLIKNMKKNIYQRDVKRKNNCKDCFASEKNKHKYNKNISEYIYSIRNSKNKNNHINIII